MESRVLAQIRNVEILKIRFGEAALHVCDVMMKDMADSKRVDQHVQSQNTVSLFRRLLLRTV
jgi:anaphase-promoting complex subunit 2